MTKTHKLSTRQWELYKYIKKYSLKGEWKHRREIQMELKHLYPVTSANFFNDASIRIMTADIKAINKCTTIQKMIVANTNKGVKLATKEEAIKHLENRKIRALKELAEVKNLMRKGYLNNQKRLKFSKYEKEVIEAFVDENKEETK